MFEIWGLIFGRASFLGGGGGSLSEFYGMYWLYGRGRDGMGLMHITSQFFFF